MQLSVTKPHKSITDLPNIALPKFTLLVGPNGAGKSQLLEAVQSGQVVCTDSDGGQIPQQSVRMFNWANFLPRNEKAVAAGQYDKQRADLWKTVQQVQQHVKKQLVHS